MVGDLGDTLGAGRGRGRENPVPVSAPRRPPDPTAAQRSRWAQPGYDRFRDAEHQRWAQGHRSVETLREGGRRAYAAMVGRMEGQRYTIEHGVEYRLANPTVGERAMIDRLAELGQRERVDYAREYTLWYTRPEGGRAFKIPDMAWPERRLLIEVQGSIRASPRYGACARANDAQKAAIYRREGWRMLAVTEEELLRDPAGVRERVRAFLAGPDGTGRAEEEGTGGRDT